MISNRDIRRQMAVIRRKWRTRGRRRPKLFELELEAILRGLAVARDCSCCMERWRTPDELREYQREIAEIKREIAETQRALRETEGG